MPKHIAYHCDKCDGITTGADYCDNPECPNQPCCGRPLSECSCLTVEANKPMVWVVLQRISLAILLVLSCIVATVGLEYFTLVDPEEDWSILLDMMDYKLPAAVSFLGVGVLSASYCLYRLMDMPIRCKK